MGFLESVKRTLNIAGAEIGVLTEDEVYSQGDRVRGQMQITAGEYEQSGVAIVLRLVEYWTESQYNAATKSSTTVTRYKTHDTVTAAGAFTLAARDDRVFDFEVALPRNARISRSNSGWQLSVRLDVPGAIDPTGNVILQVQPGEELLAVVEACEFGLRFEEDRARRSWHRTSGSTYFRLRPPKVLEAEFDYMAMQLLQCDEGGIEGTLTFDLQEKSIGDYFKSIFNRDKVRYSIALDAETVLGPEGEAKVDAIVEVIGGVMRKIIESRS